jgi:hypothetical protein
MNILRVVIIELSLVQKGFTFEKLENVIVFDYLLFAWELEKFWETIDMAYKLL